MLLSQQEFEEKFANNNLQIALIGMSNIGKSYWANQMSSRHGFNSFEVDMAIQEQLNLSSISAAANWMGHPYEEDYPEKARQYLGIEGEQTLRANAMPGNLVLDTTGSVIHLDTSVRQHITTNFLVVYLEANSKNIQTLIKRFSTSPKPLIWGEYYTELENVPRAENLIRSYPELLKARVKKYENMADITLNISALKTSEDVDFLQVLRSALDG